MKISYRRVLSALAFAAVGIGFSASSAHAQLNSGTTIVTVTVVDILALTVSVPAVPISMGTLTEYQSGSGFTAPAQLVASSNQPYDVKVKSNGDLVGTLTAAGSSIPISNIMVQSSPTTAGTFGTAVNLSSTDQVLISNAAAGMAKTYDVKYSTAANNAAFYVKGGAYAATLTYSLVAH
jgi:hypothetical protein